MLRILLFFLFINAHASDLESCSFKNITELDSFAATSSQEIKLILAPHLIEKEVIFDSWPVLCGSILFELKKSASKEIFKNWQECLKGRKEVDTKISTQIKKCVKKILF